MRHHLDKYRLADPALISLVRNSLYVDDLVTGADTVDEAFNIYKGARRLMVEAGMNLRKWSSNSPELMKLIQADECKRRDDVVEVKSTVMEEEESYANSQITLFGSNYPNYEVSSDYFGKDVWIVSPLISPSLRNTPNDYLAQGDHC